MHTYDHNLVFYIMKRLCYFKYWLDSCCLFVFENARDKPAHKCQYYLYMYNAAYNKRTLYTPNFNLIF